VSAADRLVAELPLAEQRWYARREADEVRRRAVDVVPLPPVGAVVVLEVTFADGTADLYAVPAAGDRESLRPALPGDGVFAALGGEPGRPERALGIDQTHTSVIAGDAVVKAYRRLAVGIQPEAEILERLAETGFAGVPGLRRTVHRDLPDGRRVSIALVQDLVTGAPDGWESLIEPLELAISTGAQPEINPDLERIGQAAGSLHTALATAFGTRISNTALTRGWRSLAVTRLHETLAVLPDGERSELEALAPRIERELAGLDAAKAPITRIHGDLHVAQFLRTPAAVLVVDFEGDPLLPVEARRQPASPMWDLACLLRSLDHVARSAQVRCAGRGADGTMLMDAWIPAAQEAVLSGYETGLGDARLVLDRPLLRRLAIAKELGEFAYAARHLPSWLYAPVMGMRWLMRDDASL
jgi:maltokinase